MMAMAIPAAISSYSIAVAPDSSVKNIKSRRLLSLLLPPRLPTLRVRWINPKYGFMGLCQKGRLLMKTTIEVSDDLYRRAKAEAALRAASSRTSSQRDCGWCSKRHGKNLAVGAWPH